MSKIVEITRLRQRLDDAFERIDGIDPRASQLQSDFARYLCVLVSGYVEKAVAHLLQEHARRNGSPSLQSFVESHTIKWSNATSGKIEDLLGSFNEEWRRDIKEYLVPERRAAINSIVGERNQIAHGGTSGITYHRIREYYEHARNVVEQVQRICLGEEVG